MIQSQHDSDVVRYVGAHGVAQLLLWSGFYYVLPALSAQIATETGWPILHISTTYTGAFFVWAICAPVVGALIDRGQGAKVMRIGAIIGIALMFGLSVTSSAAVFSLLVVLLGVCMAATLYDPCFAMMMLRLKPNGAHAVATVTLIAGFATLLTFPLVIGLSAFMDWQQIIQIFAVLATIGMMVMPFEAETLVQRPKLRSKMPLEKGPVLIALSFGLVMMGHAILLFLLPMALVSAGGQTHGALLALAILGPAQIAGRTAWKYYGAALRPQNSAVVMFICLCFPALILLLIGTTPFALYSALIIQGACYGVHTILRPNLAQCYVLPSQLGRGLGAIAMVGLMMMAIGPAVGGLVWTIAGISGVMIAILLLNGLALLLGVILRSTATKEVML